METDSELFVHRNIFQIYIATFAIFYIWDCFYYTTILDPFLASLFEERHEFDEI
jgi:hypothetical protein